MTQKKTDAVKAMEKWWKRIAKTEEKSDVEKAYDEWEKQTKKGLVRVEARSLQGSHSIDYFETLDEAFDTARKWVESYRRIVEIHPPVE